MNPLLTKFKALEDNVERALIPFLVIGDPDYKTSLDLLKAVAKEADMLELGFAFSDPIADGKTVQQADQRALKAGMTTEKNFELIKELRKETDIPINLLVYANLIYQQGIGKFFRLAQQAKVDSVLIADVPPEESNEFEIRARKHKIQLIFMVSPLTNKERLQKIENKTTGFIYYVARLGVTGAQEDLKARSLKHLKEIKHIIRKPICVGFGISNKDHVRAVVEAGADGVIVGSALIKIIEQNLNKKEELIQQSVAFVKELKEATRYV